MSLCVTSFGQIWIKEKSFRIRANRGDNFLSAYRLTYRLTCGDQVWHGNTSRGGEGRGGEGKVTSSGPHPHSGGMVTAAKIPLNEIPLNVSRYCLTQSQSHQFLHGKPSRGRNYKGADCYAHLQRVPVGLFCRCRSTVRAL